MWQVLLEIFWELNRAFVAFGAPCQLGTRIPREQQVVRLRRRRTKTAQSVWWANLNLSDLCLAGYVLRTHHEIFPFFLLFKHSHQSPTGRPSGTQDRTGCSGTLYSGAEGTTVGAVWTLNPEPSGTMSYACGRVARGLQAKDVFFSSWNWYCNIFVVIYQLIFNYK